MPKHTSSVVFTIVTKTTPIRALARNPNRVVWSAINTSDTVIYFAYAQTVTSSGAQKGWLIPASNGTVEDEHATDEVYIICGSAGKSITFQEVSEVEEIGKSGPT